jgi:hypothetical protein
MAVTDKQKSNWADHLSRTGNYSYDEWLQAIEETPINQGEFVALAQTQCTTLNYSPRALNLILEHMVEAGIVPEDEVRVVMQDDDPEEEVASPDAD